MLCIKLEMPDNEEFNRLAQNYNDAVRNLSTFLFETGILKAEIDAKEEAASGN